MLAHLKIGKTSAINCHITSLQSQSLSCRNPGQYFITSDNDDGDKDSDDDDDDGNEQGDDNDEDDEDDGDDDEGDEDGDERRRRKLCSVALLVERRHLLAVVAVV